MQDGTIMEWAPFRLADGVSEASLLEASEALQRDFLRHQPGFRRRELLKGADGQWVDLVTWADRESADAVMDAVRSSPVCHAYFAVMAGGNSMDPGEGVLHLQRVRVYD